MICKQFKDQQLSDTGVRILREKSSGNSSAARDSMKQL